MTRNNISAQKIRISGTDSRDFFSSISEVEVWGAGNYPGSNGILIGAQIDTPTNKLANRSFTLATVDTQLNYDLKLVFAGIISESVTVNINSTTIIIQPDITVNNTTIYSYRLSFDMLWAGNNFLRRNPLSVPRTKYIC